MGGYRRQSADMGLGINYLGLGSFGFTSIAADIVLDNFANRHLQYGYYQFNTGQRVDYSSGSFLSGIRFVQYMKIGAGIPPGDDGVAHGKAYVFNGYLGYRIDGSIRITPRIDLTYIHGGTAIQNYRWGIDSVNADYNAFADKNTAIWAGKNRYDSGLVIDPTVEFELANGTILTLGYKRTMHFGDPLPANANNIKNFNMVFIDFNFRF